MWGQTDEAAAIPSPSLDEAASGSSEDAEIDSDTSTSSDSLVDDTPTPVYTWAALSSDKTKIHAMLESGDSLCPSKLQSDMKSFDTLQEARATGKLLCERCFLRMPAAVRAEVLRTQ
jgi:hypothetical protein